MVNFEALLRFEIRYSIFRISHILVWIYQAGLAGGLRLNRGFTVTGQVYLEDAAQPGLAFHIDIAVASLDDVVNRRQSEARALSLFLGGKKGLKNAQSCLASRELIAGFRITCSICAASAYTGNRAESGSRMISMFSLINGRMSLVLS